MTVLIGRRASAILFNLLVATDDRRPFLLPANICPIVPLTFMKAGRPFRAVDIRREDLCIDIEECLRLLSHDPDGYAGVLFVRPYGAEFEVDSWFTRIKEIRPDLIVIDDKCLCPPDCAGDRLTSVADITLFSTGPSKFLDLQVGGFAHVRTPLPYRPHNAAYAPAGLEEVTKAYKSAMQRRERFIPANGEWLDLSDAGVTWDSHRRRTEAELRLEVDHRERVLAVYEEIIPAEMHLPKPYQAWRFNIWVPDATRVLSLLREESLPVSQHYASIGGVFCDGRYPVAEEVHSRIINLFLSRQIDPTRARLTATRLMQVCSAF
ncbi:MAG: hypothetical protein HYX75_25110 [Acidobacteria bacterium]|nr:hypothetical protein [Acidobacteriota bacterium]